MRQRRRILFIAAGALLFALILGRLAADLYVEVLWFSHLGYAGYFWRTHLYRWGVGLTFGLVAAAFVYANLHPLLRTSPQLRVRRRYGNIEIAELFPRWYLTLGVILLALLFGWAFGLYMERLALPILQWLNAPDWMRSEPIFGGSVGFYVFTLPILSGLHGFSILLALATAVPVVAGHALTGGLRFEDGRPVLSVLARKQLAVLVVLILVIVAAGFWLGTRELLWSGSGVTGSLGYTDIHAGLTARRILVGISLATAGLTGYGLVRAEYRYAIGSLAVLLLATLGLGQAYPAVIQKVRVEPNELDRERPYLEMNIAFTRSAYALDRFDERNYPLDLSRTPSEAELERTTTGLPLWDPRPLRATYNQFQGINPYYRFTDVDYDRYGSPDAIEQVAVSVREIDVSQLPSEARTWQNLHLSETYTHGVGLVMSPAARIAPAGEPAYYVAGMPPTVTSEAPPDIRLERPEIYFGELTEQWVLFRDDPDDADGPDPLGVELDSFIRKLSFAWSLGDANLLLSQEIRPGTRILYGRIVRERIRRLAPFLRLDPDVYPVLMDGRVVWVQDAYTVSPHYPLSQRIPVGREEVSYVRNSVKITVDAATGRTTLYVADPRDPLVMSLGRTFPGLFRPLDEMPDPLRRHLRYPREHLLVQARVLRAYHVRDVRAFYHQLDLWDLPMERYREGEELVRPYYVVMPDPLDGARPDYLLVFPFTARGRDNMRAFLVARSDLDADPRVTLFRLPSEQVLGPRQVEVQIDQDPLISQQFTLWQQRGSRVIRGHLLVVPVGGTFVYVEPIFLEAESGGAAPNLERVVVVGSGRATMGGTLRDALAAWRSGEAPELVEETRPTGARLSRLRDLISRADSALRAGDFAEFGRVWSEIRALARPGAER